MWVFGRHGTSARAVHNPWARIRYSLQAVMLFYGSVLRHHDFSGQTPWFLSILAVCSVLLRVRHALFREAASFTVFLHFLLTGTWLKSCLGATSVKNCQNFVDHRIPLHHSPLFRLVVPGKHSRTSSWNIVASRSVNTSWNKEESLFGICCRKSAVCDPMLFLPLNFVILQKK